MILAVTYDINDKTVNQGFGETKNFLLYDTLSKEEKIIDNRGYSHKALIPYLASMGVNAVICGGIGAPAVMLFNNADIEVIPGITGDAHDAIDKFLKGSLIGNFSVVHECGCHH